MPEGGDRAQPPMGKQPSIADRAGAWLRGKIWPGLDKALTSQGAGPAPGARQLLPVKQVDSQVRQIAPKPAGESPSYTSLPGRPVKKVP